jgi:tetratricopeptide (TPR) repeat protein
VGKDSIALNILEQEEKKLSDSYANITAFGYINYYLRKNDVENASKQYERISDFVEEFGSPSSVEVFFRARLYKLEGEYEKAIDTYESFRLQNSYVSNAVIDNRIAECYISNNQYDKAENILKDLLKTYPFDPTTYYHLAIIYNEQGKLNDARASIEIANKIWINADEAYAKAQQAKTLYNILQPVL